MDALSQLPGAVEPSLVERLPPGRFSGIAFLAALRVFLEAQQGDGAPGGTQEALAELAHPLMDVVPRELEQKFGETHHCFSEVFGLPAAKLAWFDVDFFKAVYLRCSVNAFKTTVVTGLADEHDITSLHTTPSLFNHSCSPNVEMGSDGAVLTFKVGDRDVQEGEELVISYLDVDKTQYERERSERKEELAAVRARAKRAQKRASGCASAIGASESAGTTSYRALASLAPEQLFPCAHFARTEPNLLLFSLALLTLLRAGTTAKRGGPSCTKTTVSVVSAPCVWRAT
jgi:hypothetical protein